VRQRLAEHDIAQPGYALAADAGELRSVIEQVGLPAILKPADGYGSTSIILLEDANCMHRQVPFLERALRARIDYGLGEHSSGRFLLEQRLRGRLLGCDVFSDGGEHRVLGVHEKLLYAEPSFAIRGGTFLPAGAASLPAELQAYVTSVLDAVEFDCGASHVEVMLTKDGPRLVEVNPRLVGSTISRLAGLGTGRSLHADLIALHLGEGLPPRANAGRVAVSRWISSPREGVLDSIVLPATLDPTVVSIDQFVHSGERVRRPAQNRDRLACVMTCAEDRAHAEAVANRVVEEIEVRIKEQAS
jgi:biotin carboxylase